MTDLEKNREQIVAFADEHLFPYKIRGKSDHAEEIVPVYCPFCQGGANKDEGTFALSIDKGVFVCKRGSCGKRGQFSMLAEFFGEETSVKSAKPSKKNEETQYVLPTTELKPVTDEIYAYFEKRGISKATVDAFRIASDENGMIVFPFYVDGVNVYEKFRRPWKPKPTEKGKEWASPGAKPVLFGMDACSFSKPLIITEGQCFPGDAEILTESGWKRFDEYDGSQKVCQVHDDLTADFATPIAIVQKEYEGELLATHIGGNYCSITTPDHGIVVRSLDGELKKVRADQVVRGGKWEYIPTTVNLDGRGISLSEDQIALYLAICADCTIDLRKTTRHCRFAVKKKRKYARMKAILDRLGIEYHDSGLLNSGYYYIGFTTPEFVENKRIPESWQVDATVEQRKFILNEMVFWDGNTVPNRAQTEFSSRAYEDASVIQTLAHTSGCMSTVIKKQPRYVYKGKERYGIVYKASVLQNKNHVSTQRWIPEPLKYSGTVYCVSVPTGMILVRQEGHITVSGNCDAMALYEAGISNVVSVPSGCENLNWIENCYDWLARFNSIILFGDNDEPGRKMIQQVVKRLDESRCRIVKDYPNAPSGQPCKDANEILCRHGWSALVDMVENAEAIPIKGIIDLSEVVPYDPTTIPRIKTQIPDLDEILGGLVEGGVTVFTGKAGDGKSTLSGLLLLNAIEQGYNVCAYSGELRKEKFQEWINLQCAGSDYISLKYDPIRQKHIPYIPFAVQQRLMDYYRGKFFLFDNNEIFEHNQAESILNVFTTAVRRYGCKLFLVDNMMTSLSDCEEETKAQGRFVNALKKFANRYSVHVLIVAHPRKTKAGEQLRKDDVGGNSAIVNLADSAIVVERPNLRIIKNREGGVQKLIECCYCGDSRRIYQMNRGDLNHFSWNKEGLRPFEGSLRADHLPEYGVMLGNNLPF